MPSCDPASISDRFSPARITVTALRLPCSASACNRSRRAEMSENSDATKNALAASSSTVSSTPKTSLMVVVSLFGASAQFGELEEVDATAVHADHRGQPVCRVVGRMVGVERGQLDGLAGLGDVTEFLQHQPADRLVFAFGGAETGRGRDLVDAQQARDLPATA